MTEGQLRELEKTHQAPVATAFYSTASGFITSLDIAEGDYVMGGQTIMRLANTSSVWVEAQLYTSQLAGVDLTGKVTVQIPEQGNRQYTGRIELVNPLVDPQKRINLIRVSIPNPGNELKPGMAAYIFVNSKQHRSLTLPEEAVIRSGPMALVWVQSGDNTFRYKMVTTGMENNGQVEITYGLQAGDAVVTSGAYLLNSEYKLRNGGSGMQGM
jgi:Cu(I)/Ag(I) efflux system membrane fusion protein